MNPFDYMREDEAIDFAGHAYGYVANWQAREDAAERRHQELVETITGVAGAIAGAVAAGLRATADALDKSLR